MASQYDELGSTYDTIKSLPPVIMEDFNVKHRLGNIKGLTILDLASGSGHSSRNLIQWGAQKVVGVDLSPVMVDNAREISKGDTRLEYQVQDCVKPFRMRPFDLVTAVWMFNYAANEEEMSAMWRNIANNLKPGGRFVGLVPNARIAHTKAPELPPSYKVTMETKERVKHGQKVLFTVHSASPFSFQFYVLEPKLYEKCARDAGMRDFAWHSPVFPEGFDEGLKEYWKRSPMSLVITAVRGKRDPDIIKSAL